MAHGKDGTYVKPLSGEGGNWHESRAQRQLVVSLSVTLARIRDSAGVYATDEIIMICHDKSLNVDVYKDKVESHQDCGTITQHMIEIARSPSF